jgi:hypothetical protein
MDLCLQNDRISRVEIAVDKIATQVGELGNAFAILTERLNPILAKVEEHDRTLLGCNGEVGLVAKVETAMDIQESLRMLLKGREGQGGMMTILTVLGVQVQTLIDQNKSRTEERTWLTRVVVGMLVAGTISAFAYLLATHGLSFLGQPVP